MSCRATHRPTQGKRKDLDDLDRQRIMNLIHQGLTPKQISIRMGISLSCARNYVSKSSQ